jgi:hypothetical protein
VCGCDVDVCRACMYGWVCSKTVTVADHMSR